MPNQNTNKTHCKHGHEFNEENTRILANGDRECIACSRDRYVARRKQLGHIHKKDRTHCKRGHPQPGSGECKPCRRTYKSWAAMIDRCTNPNNKHYHHYGGRGIKVCARWYSFDNFLADMGIRPEDMTLDRIDPDMGYCPTNCRWAGFRTQVSNRRKISATDLAFLKAMQEPTVFTYSSE